jgi:hypothetical protein
MALTGGERRDLISEVATVLDKREWPDIDLILEQHELPTQYSWASDENRSQVIEMVKGGAMTNCEPSTITLLDSRVREGGSKRG